MKNALFLCVAAGALCTAAAIAPAEAQGRVGGIRGAGGVGHSVGVNGGGRVLGGPGGDWDRRGGGWGWGPAAAVGVGLAAGAVAADVAYGGYDYGYGYDYAPGYAYGSGYDYAPSYASGAGYDCSSTGPFGWSWGGGSCYAPAPVAAVTYSTGPAYGYDYGYDQAPGVYRSARVQVRGRVAYRGERVRHTGVVTASTEPRMYTGRSVAVSHGGFAGPRQPRMGGTAGVASGGADMRGAGASHGAGPLGGNPR